MHSSRDDKYKHIIDTAAELFDNYGYGASMDSISKRANVSKQTLYVYFKNKEALYEHYMKEKCFKLPLTEIVLDRAKPIDEALFSFAQKYHLQQLQPKAIHLYQHAVGQISSYPEFPAMYLQYDPKQTLETVSRYLEDKVIEGTILLNNSSTESAIQLLLMFQGKAVHWRRLGIEIDMNEKQRDIYLKNCIDMFLNNKYIM